MDSIKNPTACEGSMYTIEYIGGISKCILDENSFRPEYRWECYLRGGGWSVDEAQSSRIWCRSNGCPDASDYNGYTCIFADGSCEWKCLAIHCHKRTGKWNAIEKACVECNSDGTRKYLLAKGSTRCWDLTDTSWEEYYCAKENQGKCDYGCGASYECNGKAKGLIDTNKLCDSNCQLKICNNSNLCKKLK